ncbi:PAS domain S-box protein [Rhizobium oryziradicis]|nr:PAS domain S-box protein [Rhizobium oryziradicis]
MKMDRGALLQNNNVLKMALSAALGAAIFCVEVFTHAQAGLASLYVCTLLILPEAMPTKDILFIFATCALLSACLFASIDDINQIYAVIFFIVNILMYLYILYFVIFRRKETEYLSNLATEADDAIIISDAQDQIVYWSHGSELLYGWSSSEAKGQVSTTLLKTIFPVSQEACHAALLRDGKWEGELSQISKHGKRVMVLSRRLLQHDGSGAAHTTIETTIDMTLNCDRQDHIQKAAWQSDDVFRNILLAQMTSSVAHDLSQPISALMIGSKASLRWLQRDVCNIDEAKNAVENVIANAHRAGEVVGRVRQLAGPDTNLCETIALHSLIKQALETHQSGLLYHRVALEMAFEDELPELTGNQTLLSKVFADLLISVVNARPSGLSAYRLKIEIKKHINYFGLREIIVEIGARSAFDHFDRLVRDKEPSQDLVNDTIGSKLAVCRFIIESHSWRLDIASDPSYGVAFRIKIPIQKDNHLEIG